MDDLNSSFAFSQFNNFSSAKIKIEELFSVYLRTECHNNKLFSVLNEVLKNTQIVNEDQSEPTADGYSSPNERDSNASSSKLLIKKSPKKRSQAEISKQSSGSVSSPSSVDFNKLSLNSSSSSMDVAPSTSGKNKVDGENNSEIEDHNTPRRRANFDKIPPFYVPGKPRCYFSQTGNYSYTSHNLEDDKLSKKLPEIEAFFKPFPGGIPVEKFVHVTKRLCGIPSFFNLPLCRRINERFGEPDAGVIGPRTIGRHQNRQPSGVKIKLKTFLKFWQAEVEPFDRLERFFRVIKKHEADYIFKDDFLPFLQELLHFHPGLDFLEQHEEFQVKYALTVITRIFYKVNTSRSGKISLREVRKSNLFQACMHVDEETDINKVLDYFSYEHFYVIYCKFFELDTDKDSRITKHDLLKYGEHALTETIVDRIFQVGTKVFTDGELGGFDNSGMTYPDFIFFMLSEEDKTNESALRYWFRCCDLDGDGKLTPEEMRFFYRNQIQRINSLGQESINFEDVLCQMMDMVSPVDPHAITIEDLIRIDKRMISGVLYDVLFNLHKFMRFESRDPFQEKLRREDIFHTDWDRYAHIEYNRLAQEEEESYDNSMDIDSARMDPNGDLDQMHHWSLNDEEESEDEDDMLIGNRIVGQKGGNGNNNRWGNRR